MFGLFGDKELKAAKAQFEGKTIVEILKRKEKAHKVVWVGRSDFDDKAVRIGVVFEGRENASFFNLADLESKMFNRFEIR